MNLLQDLRRTVRLYGSQPATFCGEHAYSWAEFEQRTARLANALYQRGLRRGQKMALLLRNCHRMLEFYYALPRLGVAVVPLNPRLAPAELQFMLEDAEVAALAVDPFSGAYLDQLDLVRAGIQNLVYCADGPEGQPTTALEALYYEALVAEAEPLPLALTDEPADDELAGIFYTGGTTGRPKGVLLTQHNLALSALHNVVAFEYTQTDRHLHASPMFHSADCSQAWAITLIGGSHIFLPAFEPGAMLSAINRYRATTTLVVPTMLLGLLNRPDFGAADLSSLRRVLYGAAPISRSLLERALAAFPCPLWQGFGAAETGPLMAVLRPEEHLSDHLASAGRPIPGVEIQIVDQNGQERPNGEVGEIAARGNLMAGYWKQPEETARVLRDGFYHTGDLAYCDSEGFIYIVDRHKDMVITGGENVYTIEVERALLSHPAVGEAAVFGIPDEKWGEAVHALVVLRTGVNATPAELIAHVKGRIAHFKAPRTLEIVERLPTSGAGKILKSELRNRYWAGRDRKV